MSSENGHNTVTQTTCMKKPMLVVTCDDIFQYTKSTLTSATSIMYLSWNQNQRNRHTSDGRMFTFRLVKSVILKLD